MTLAYAAVALGALAQATSGLGFALVAGPLLIAALGADKGVGTVVLLSLVLNIVMLMREHHSVRYADAAVMLVPAVVATPLLVAGVRRIDERPAALAAGVLIVVACLLLLTGARAVALRGRTGAILAGGTSAVMNAIAGIGGPPIALFAANAGWPAQAMRSTMQAIFLVLNVVLLSVRGWPRISPRLLIAMAVGYLAGAVVTRWISDEAARRATLFIAAAGGVALIVRVA